MELRLTELRDGESGIITSIKASQGRGWGGRRAGRGWGLKRRLEDMGLTPGTKVTVVNSAPFHGPLEVYVRGSRLAIGRGMAERIFVETQRPHDRDSAEGSTFLKAHTNGEGDSAEG